MYTSKRNWSAEGREIRGGSYGVSKTMEEISHGAVSKTNKAKTKVHLTIFSRFQYSWKGNYPLKKHFKYSFSFSGCDIWFWRHTKIKQKKIISHSRWEWITFTDLIMFWNLEMNLKFILILTILRARKPDCNQRRATWFVFITIFC